MKPIDEDAKDKKIEVYGESEEIKKLADKIVEDRKRQIAQTDYFLKVPFMALPLIQQMGTSFELLLYMANKITGPSKINDWWGKNVRPYFYEGYLPFAMHLDFIAKDLKMTKMAASKRMIILRDLEVIQLLERVRFSENRYMNIWSLGRNIRKHTVSGTIDYEYHFYFNMIYKNFTELKVHKKLGKKDKNR